jgi:hypothetical protein
MSDELSLERIAHAMERIADVLEQMNAVRIWPTMQPVGGATGPASPARCSTCGAWWLGSHICVTSLV